MATVSIIVPVYKVESYLHDCVDSIVGQSYRDIQLVLVDDGSPDNCGSICDEYARKDSRILALHKKNGGVSSARNYGLKYAAGKYLTFCDSDDMYAPDWIENLVKAMEEYEADLVLGNYYRIFDSGALRIPCCHETGITEMVQLDDKARYCIEKVLSEKHAWEIWDRLFRTDIVKKNNIRFCETCGNFAEDLGFTLAYSLCANRVVSIEAAGYLYRIREGSMMQSSINQAKLDAVNEVFLHVEPICRRVFSPDIAEAILPVFHFLIMYEQYMVALREGNYQEAADAMQKIRRQTEWKFWVRKTLGSKKELTRWFGKYQAERVLLLMRFCIHKNVLRYKVERRIFYMLKNKMDDCYGNEG